MPETTEHRPAKGRGLMVLFLAGALALGVGGRWVYRAAYERRVHLPDVLQAQVDLLPDENAREGTPNAGATEEELPTGRFQVVINQLPSMEDGKSPCRILAENPATNPYDLRVCLYLKETGELLGATHRIERGKRVDEIMLDRELAAGEYPILAKLELFDEDLSPAGELGLDLTLLVRS